MAGWVLPRFFLEKQVKKRQEIIRLSLPDALDMLVVSVEAGLGLDQAIQHVAREIHVSHPQLSEEMQMVTLEMRAGKRRSEAMRNFAERTGESEIRKLVAILIQNDRFGTSMGESLRNHSDFMRTAPQAGRGRARRESGREASLPHLLFHPAVDGGGGGGSRTFASFQRPVPHDEEHGRRVERRNAMDSQYVQAVMWLVAGGIDVSLPAPPPLAPLELMRSCGNGDWRRHEVNRKKRRGAICTLL